MARLQRNESSAQSFRISKRGPRNEQEAGPLAKGSGIFKDRASARPQHTACMHGCRGERWLSGYIEADWLSAPPPKCSSGKVEPEEETQEKCHVRPRQGIHWSGLVSLHTVRILIISESALLPS